MTNGENGSASVSMPGHLRANQSEHFIHLRTSGQKSAVLQLFGAPIAMIATLLAKPEFPTLRHNSLSRPSVVTRSPIVPLCQRWEGKDDGPSQ